MLGKVKMINLRTGMIAVETSTREYSVLELLGGYVVELGDIISGDLEDLGGGEVFNKTQDEVMDVVIQDCYCDARRVRELLS